MKVRDILYPRIRQELTCELRVDSTSLWAESVVNLPISNGAALFRKTVKSVVRGNDRHVQVVLQVYQNWAKSIVAAFQVIKSILDVQKLDDLDMDDEFGLGSDTVQDGFEDAEMLQGELRRCLERSFKDLEAEVEKFVKGCEEELQTDGKGIYAHLPVYISLSRMGG